MKASTIHISVAAGLTILLSVNPALADKGGFRFKRPTLQRSQGSGNTSVQKLSSGARTGKLQPRKKSSSGAIPFTNPQLKQRPATRFERGTRPVFRPKLPNFALQGAGKKGGAAQPAGRAVLPLRGGAPFTPVGPLKPIEPNLPPLIPREAPARPPVEPLIPPVDPGGPIDPREPIEPIKPNFPPLIPREPPARPPVEPVIPLPHPGGPLNPGEPIEPIEPNFPPLVPEDPPADAPADPPVDAPADPPADPPNNGGVVVPIPIPFPVPGGGGCAGCSTTVVETVGGGANSSGGIDLELVEVRQLDRGNPAENQGPAYRVLFRNRTAAAVPQSFNVALAASVGRLPASDSAYTVERIDGLSAGEPFVVRLRLPAGAYAIGRNAVGQVVPFSWLTAVVDSHQELPDADRQNDYLTLHRNEIVMFIER